MPWMGRFLSRFPEHVPDIYDPTMTRLAMQTQRLAPAARRKQGYGAAHPHHHRRDHPHLLPSPWFCYHCSMSEKLASRPEFKPSSGARVSATALQYPGMHSPSPVSLLCSVVLDWSHTVHCESHHFPSQPKPSKCWTKEMKDGLPAIVCFNRGLILSCCPMRSTVSFFFSLYVLLPLNKIPL